MYRKVPFLKISKQEEQIGDPYGVVGVQAERDEGLIGTNCNPLQNVSGCTFWLRVGVVSAVGWRGSSRFRFRRLRRRLGFRSVRRRCGCGGRDRF